LIGFEVLSFSSVFFCLLAILHFVFVVVLFCESALAFTSIGCFGFLLQRYLCLRTGKALGFLGSRHHFGHGAVVFRSPGLV
jgi:hypothetical protein